MTNQVRTIIRQLNEFSDEVTRRLAVNVVDELVRATPVDTGWARANWIISVGATLGVPIGPPGVAGVEIAEVFQRQSLANLFLTSIQGQPIFLENNVPYIDVLNEGSSAQAPAGFVQAAIQIGFLRTT